MMGPSDGYSISACLLGCKKILSIWKLGGHWEGKASMGKKCVRKRLSTALLQLKYGGPGAKFIVSQVVSRSEHAIRKSREAEGKEVS